MTRLPRRGPGLSAKGAKCKSLGHRPRWNSCNSLRALKVRITTRPWCFRCHSISRFQRSQQVTTRYLGRCPGLLHCAPLALGIWVLPISTCANKMTCYSCACGVASSTWPLSVWSSRSIARRRCGIVIEPPTTSAILKASRNSGLVTPAVTLCLT